MRVGSVVVLLGQRECEQSADLIKVVGSKPVAMIGGATQRGAGLSGVAELCPGAGLLRRRATP